MGWLIALLFCAVVAMFVIRRHQMQVKVRVKRIFHVHEAQNSIIEIIRQNTEALRAVETALNNTSDILEKLEKLEKLGKE